MIPQKLTKTKTKMILITKTLVIFRLFTLTSFAATAGAIRRKKLQSYRHH